MAGNGKELARWPFFTSWWPGVEGEFPRLSRHLDEFTRALRYGQPERYGTEWTPAIDLHETDEAMTITMPLPGVKMEEITVEVTPAAVEVRGEKKAEHEEKEKAYRIREVAYGTFYRHVELPAEADADKAQATLKDGSLTIAIPKQVEARAKTVKVAVK